MTISRRILAPILVLAALFWPTPASADLILSFDQSNYDITLPGQPTVMVNVFVSQTAGGAQVGVGNELVSAAIELSFLTGGAATIVSTSDVTPNPAWDVSSVMTSTNGANTLMDVGLNSLLGFSDLSSPLLLATFTFTGQFAGVLPIQVAQLDPNSPDFITVNGDVLDPTNTPTASVNVGTGTVPEPASLALLALGSLAMSTRWLRRWGPKRWGRRTP